ncbi:unnamed protein product [Vitrella brassicaformis CCMP3155]|uniref:Uncharacterized protein n=1 Tax=Vitrella brassicaformis (strain CCMP3155) TaxID=1169540 RepID=A0A0G4FU34_VITBC|nr:unnamed protein product [Vitrella brassicaformis CCMP3155]|eukprot:CEM17806.1 unnamed protein product [Vitrella brassicaformis CCMP3155]
MAASSSDAQPGGGGAGGESDEERQRRAERERSFWGNAPPGLLSIVIAFLPIHLLMQLQLPPLTWQLTARKQHHLTVSAADEDERSFWQRTTIDLVKEWATYLRQLTCVVLCYPLGFPSWCFDVFVAIIEGHIAGRREANLGGETLETIAIEGLQRTGTARRARTDPLLPAPLDPLPTLDALTTIAGLTHQHEVVADRHWLVPSFAVVGQEGWDADRLGRLISSSRSLRCVDGSFKGEEWADVFERIPAAPVGQQGPLAQLEGIGTINIDDGDHRAGIDRLQEVLIARGCRRSLKQLHVVFEEHFYIDRPSIPVLQAVNRLVTTCCRQDAPLTLTPAGPFYFGLDIFYHGEFPDHPSPSFKTMIQQLAERATKVKYILSQQDLTDNLDSPSPSAIDVASSLSFDKATMVVVQDAPDFVPPGNTPSPHPAIITFLQPFSTQATVLGVWSDLGLGGAAGRLLADKMPKELTRVGFDPRMSGAEEKVGVLTGLGREREVGTVSVWGIGVDQLVGAANELPTIRELSFELTLPDGVQDAGSFVRTSLSSMISCIRGLRSVRLEVDDATAEQHGIASIEASLPDGANNVIEGFTIRHEHRRPDFVVVTAVRNA